LNGRNYIRPVKNRSTNPQRFCSGTDAGGGPEGNQLMQVHLEKWLTEVAVVVELDSR